MSHHIVIVDDSPSIRRMIAQTLAAEGFDVSPCSSGAEAIAAAKARKVDAVVSDLNMPEIDGLELTRQLRKLPNTHPVFRSHFKFDGPPTTAFELNGWGDDLVHDYLKGIEIDGRMGVLYSNKDYGCEWDYDWRNKRWNAEDNSKFAVNIVVYALTA